MGTVVELPGQPALGPAYRRAILRRSAGTDVPDLSLRLRDVPMSRTHLAGYARACGFRLTDALPGTYPHVLAFPLAMTLMSRSDFPFPLLGLVHVANTIDVLRPVDAGERLTITVHAEDLRPHERGRQIDVVAVASSSSGEEVWRGRSTYLHRSGSSSGGRSSGGGSSGDGRSSGGGSSGDGRSAPPPGPEAPDAIWTVAPTVGREYADVSGDRNPIHTSRLLARALGFKRTIAHGMWTKARCLAALEGRLPPAYTVDVSFKLPILLPARVGFTARQVGSGWEFGVRDARSGKPHLTGRLGGSP